MRHKRILENGLHTDQRLRILFLQNVVALTTVTITYYVFHKQNKGEPRL